VKSLFLTSSCDIPTLILMNYINMRARDVALNFLDFINRAVSPFHAVAVAKEELLSTGFLELHER